MATRLFPLLQAAARHERAVAAHHVASLREGVLEISKTVRELEPVSEKVEPPADRGDQETASDEALKETLPTDVSAMSEPIQERARRFGGRLRCPFSMRCGNCIWRVAVRKNRYGTSWRR